MVFEKRPEGSRWQVAEKTCSGKREQKCKGPKVGSCFMGLKNKEGGNVSIAGVD